MESLGRGVSEEAVRGDMFLSRKGAGFVETHYDWFSWLMCYLFLFYALTSDLDLKILMRLDLGRRHND